MNMEFQELYQRMFAAKQVGDDALAERLMIEMEELRKREYSAPSPVQLERVVPLLPDFAAHVLGKSQSEVGSDERANCINAAFNFHDSVIRHATYSTMEFLDRIRSEFRQVGSEYQFGDLVVAWSRTGGSWDSRSIDVHQINESDADFPYGLVFDHIMVRVSEDLVFHKANPTLESRYHIDFLASVVMPNTALLGFELTHHRRI